MYLTVRFYEKSIPEDFQSFHMWFSLRFTSVYGHAPAIVVIAPVRNIKNPGKQNISYGGDLNSEAVFRIMHQLV